MKEKMKKNEFQHGKYLLGLREILNGREQFSEIIIVHLPEVSRMRKKKLLNDIPVLRHFIFYVNMKLMWTRPCIPTTFGIVSN